MQNIHIKKNNSNAKEERIMNQNPYPDILTIDDLMAILLIGRNKCYELLNSGKIKGMKTGKKNWKIPKESVMEYIYNTHSSYSN